MYGTLYGIGVGPGDPELLTLRAVRLLQEVPVILAAASPRNNYSTALDIAAEHIGAQARIVRLEFPMTRHKETLHEAWQKAARSTADILEQGENAAFLTLGDPLIYSTFTYLSRTLKSIAPHLATEVVPGITSFQAAAARTGTTLCEAEENLLILPGINAEESLTHALRHADNAVILKAYKNFSAIKGALKSTDFFDNALLASHVGQEKEQLCHNLNTAPQVPPYLSLILAKKNK